MKIKMHAVHFHARQSLIAFLEQQVEKLSSLGQPVVDSEVFLLVGNDAAHAKTVEITLHLPGSRLFASESAPTFEAATRVAISALKSQLRRLKTRIKAIRKNARM